MATMARITASSHLLSRWVRSHNHRGRTLNDKIMFTARCIDHCVTHQHQHELQTPIRIMCNSMRQFSAAAISSKSSSALTTKGAAGMLLLLLAIGSSDPAISAWESKMKEGENDSYWMDQQRLLLADDNDDAVTTQDGTKNQRRLRNAHKHYPKSHDANKADSDSMRNNELPILPSYSRIVIVGGGMAGLHTALALAERMSNPNSQDSHIPPPSTTTATVSQSQSQSTVTTRNEIIVLDASQIGHGSSGRAKGLVVPGFQVPLENLQENALDANNNDSGGGSWTVPALVQSFSSTALLRFLQSREEETTQQSSPRYTKAIVEEMYELSYQAMDRLRNIVKVYDIHCDWVESGALEGTIHPMEDDDDEEEEEDECQMLTTAQVNEIIGRPTMNESSKKSLYKGGEYDPSCAGVNPLALTIGLANSVERWGVKIFEYTKVVGLNKKGCNQTGAGSSEEEWKHEEDTAAVATQGKFTITTDQGDTLDCDHVILCTGAESLSKNVSKRLSGSFVLVYTWMASTEPLYDQCPLKSGVVDRVLSVDESSHGDDKSSSNESKQKGRPAPMCGDDHISLNYWRNDNTEDGRLLFGSLADTYSFPKWLISWRLRNALAEVYPQLSQVKFDHVWGGKLAFALNSMPLIGRDTDYDEDNISSSNDLEYSNSTTATPSDGGVWYATGFAGHGIVPTALAGSLLANAILGIPNQQQWQLFQTYLPPASWNGYPCSRMGAGFVLGVYNTWDWMGKKGVQLPPLPKLW